jgi:dephospho-CoA kinase
MNNVLLYNLYPKTVIFPVKSRQIVYNVGDMTNNSIVIALVGMPGAGKGTCTDYISQTYNLPLLHFGNMLYEEVARRGLDNVADEKFVREDMRAQEGPAVLAKRIASQAQELINQGAKGVVLDGLYSWSEYKYLRSQFGDRLIVVAVAAPRLERYRRVLARQDGHRKYTSVEQIITRDTDEIENLEKGGPIANADYTVVNDADTRTLYEHLDKIVSSLRL